MTVINKLSQTLEMLKSCESNCNTFSMDTNDENAKQMYKQMSDSLKQCTDMLQGRINYVADQEPQYKNELQGNPTGQQNQAQSSVVSHTSTTEIPDLD